MKQEKAVFSAQHLLSLVENRKNKQYANYIEAVDSQNSQAQKAVANVMGDIFIAKKYKTPSIMFNGLVLYRALLLSATMDYLWEETYFPQGVHKQLKNICSFKGKEKDLQKRGDHYFIDLFKLPQTEQNIKYGYNFILFALELLKSIALWYPSDYMNDKEKSMFRKMYDQLRDDGVLFPKDQDYKYIKKNDEAKFKENYQRFKKLLEQSQGNLTNPTPQPPTTSDKQNSINLNINGSNINKPAASLTPTGKSGQKLIDIKGTLTSRIQKQPESKIDDVDEELSKAFKSYLQEEENQGQRNDLTDVYEHSGIIKSPQSKISKINKKEGKKVDNNMSQIKSFMKKEYLPTVVESNSQISQGTSNNSKKQKVRSKIDEVSLPNKSDMIKTVTFTRQEPRAVPQYQPRSILKQQNFVTPKRQSSKNGQHLKMSRTQKPSIHSPGKNKDSGQHLKMSRTQKPSTHSPGKNKDSPLEYHKRNHSQKSLPKTEKIKYKQSPQQQKLKTQSFWNQPFTPQKGQNSLRFTLSQMSSSRKQTTLDGISQYSELTKNFYNMRLDQKIHNVNSSYFKPLNLTMNTLRDEAIKVNQYPSSSNPFYRGHSLEARIMKEQGNRYTLSIRNTGDVPVLIGYRDMSQYKYSNQIQMLSWGDKKNLECYPSYSLLKNKYLDIKFQVFIADHSFKFLPYDLAVNGQDSFLVLPISLLDMSQPELVKNPYDIEKYSLNGTSLVSQPFSVGHIQLPAFIGGFKFKNFYPKHVDQYSSNIVGACTLQLPNQKYLGVKEKKIMILVRLVNYPKRLIDLLIIHRKKDTQEQHFAKIAMSLLYFLLVTTDTS